MRHIALAILLFGLQTSIAPQARAADSSSKETRTFPDPAAFHLPDSEPSAEALASMRGIANLEESFRTGIVGFSRNVLEDLSLQFRAPFGYAKRNPFKFAAGAIGIAALIATDPVTYPRLMSPPGSSTHSDMQRISDIGRTRNGLILAGGMAAVGVFSGSSREKNTSRMLAEAMLTSGLWTAAIKTVSGRERPREKQELHGDWKGPSFDDGSDLSPNSRLKSFPSGHATGAWATATVLAHQYPKYGIIPTLAYSGAVAVSYSRIATSAHWLSDVVLGALIGIGSARQVIGASERRASEADNARRLRFGVDVSSEYRGVHMQYRF